MKNKIIKILKLIFLQINKNIKSKNITNVLEKNLPKEPIINSCTIAIIGFGRQGKAIYDGLIAIEGIKIIAIADPSEGVFNNLNNQSVNLYKSHVELLKNEIVDIVIIATTAKFHIDLLKYTLLNTKSKILLEKPLDASYEKSFNLFKEYGDILNKRVFINYSKRSHNQYKNLKSVINKNLGNINSIFISTGKSELGMIITHYFDLVFVLTGKKPISIKSKLYENNEENVRGIDYKDYFGNVSLTFENNVEAIFTSGDNYHKKAIQLLISCSEGYLFIDESESFVLINNSNPIVLTLDSTFNSRQSIKYIISDILNDNIDNLCNYTDALFNLKLIYLARKSSESGGLEFATNNHNEGFLFEMQLA
jgi:predicted dehydrogenase